MVMEHLDLSLSEHLIVEELDALWSPAFWDDLADRIPEWDDDIRAFNNETGVLETL